MIYCIIFLLVLQSLKTDPLLATERELFVFFHCDQSRLRRAIEDVAARLQAIRVK